MSLLPDAKITTELLWQGTLIFAVLDAIVLSLLAWLVRPAAFRRLREELLLATAVFWGVLWLWVIGAFEFTFYGCLIVALALLLRAARDGATHGLGSALSQT